jgi:hypothetical protein
VTIVADEGLIADLLQPLSPLSATGAFLCFCFCFLAFFLGFSAMFSLVNPGFLPLTLVFAILIVGTRFDRPGGMRRGEEALVSGDGTMVTDRVSEQ